MQCFDGGWEQTQDTWKNNWKKIKGLKVSSMEHIVLFIIVEVCGDGLIAEFCELVFRAIGKLEAAMVGIFTP